MISIKKQEDHSNKMFPLLLYQFSISILFLPGTIVVISLLATPMVLTFFTPWNPFKGISPKKLTLSPISVRESDVIRGNSESEFRFSHSVVSAVKEGISWNGNFDSLFTCKSIRVAVE